MPMRPSRTAVVLALVAASCTSLCRGADAASAAYLQLVDKSSKKDGERHIEKTVTLSNSRAEYALTYDVSTAPDTPKGRCFSHQWVYTIGVPALGMRLPTSCNWYSQGFFDVLIDGESLRDYLAVIRTVRRGGPDACWSATWKTSKGTVRAQFLQRGDDDKLLVQIDWQTTAAAETVALKVLCYPSFFYGDKDRWIATAQREVQHSKTVDLDVAKEPWVFYQDKGTPRTKAYGACALMFRPEEVVGAAVEVTTYPIWTTVRFKPEAHRATVALWDFTGVGTNEQNLAYMRQTGPAILADLNRVAQSDWQQPLTQPFELPAERQALHGQQGEFQTTPFDKMTPTVATSHRRWAKPLAGGPVRVLVIAPRWVQRETVELAQRLDVQYDTVSVSRQDTLFEKRWLTLYGSFELYGYRPRTVISVLSDLREKLERDYDCIIAADVRNSIFPEYFLDLIKEKVRKGAGLVAIGQGRTIAKALGKQGRVPREFRAAVPIDSLPVLRDYAWSKQEGKKALVDAAELDRGRVLTLNYTVASGSNLGMTPSTHRALDFVPADYEYYQSLLAKAVLWAAKREPQASVHEVTSDRVSITSKAALRGVVLSAVVHDREGRTEAEQRQTIDLERGVAEHTLGLRLLRGGEHFLDVTISKDGKVIDWASAQFETKPTVAIEDVAVDKAVLAPGDEVRGAVRLRGVAAPARLDLRLVDSLGRLLARDRLEVAANTAVKPFALKLADPLTVAHRVEVALSDEQGLRDLAKCEVTVPNQRLDDFMFLMWSAAHNNQVRSFVLKAMADHGVDTIDNVGVNGCDGPTMATACRNAAWANLRSVPYITRIASHQKSGLVRRPCLTDPKYMDKWTAGLRERAQAAAAYGPPGHTLGDENFLVTGRLDVCSSPTCTASFRRYLREQYGDLAALNAEWGTSLASWEEVKAITLDEAKKAKQLARWADHRRHMERVFTQAHALGRKVIQEADPGARVGFDGVFNLDSWHGYDFYQLVRACDLNQVYCLRFDQVEYLRSFRAPNALQGAWHNRIGNADEVSAKRVAWHQLLHGFNSSWYWMSYSTGPGAFFPDLRPTPQMLWMEESHREIKAGVGKLLMNAERLHDRVAIHYSQASVHGNTLLDRRLPDAHLGALLAVEDLGLQYNFVAYEQIEQGALKDYRVLVMPASCAVSKKEVAAIRSFVQQGGLVVADVYPAVMDGHCKPLERAALDDLFGAAVTSTVTAKMPEQDVPALAAKPFGRGRAVLMGYPLSEYKELRQACKEAAFREALRKVVAGHGVAEPVPVMADGQPLSACEVVRLKKGDIEYVAVVKEDDIAGAQAGDATIVLPRRSYVYDVRGKRVLGNVSQVQTKVVPGVPLLYAMLPYTVDRVELQAAKARCAAGDAVTLRIKLTTSAKRLAGDHVVHLEVKGPDGEVRRHYAQNILTTAPVAMARVRLALNDPAGEWTFTAADVVSGKSAQARVAVAAAP